MPWYAGAWFIAWSGIGLFQAIRAYQRAGPDAARKLFVYGVFAKREDVGPEVWRYVRRSQLFFVIGFVGAVALSM